MPAPGTRLEGVVRLARRVAGLSAEPAQGLTEYAVILFLVALVVLVIVTVYGGQVGNLFSRVTNAISAL